MSQDLQAQNVALAQQSERYSVAVRALEKQLDLTRASLETTQGKACLRRGEPAACFSSHETMNPSVGSPGAVPCK